MKRIIALFLILGITLSCFFSISCKDKEIEGDPTTPTETSGRLSDITLEPVENEFLVKQAKSDYKIVVKRNAGTDLSAAVSELKYFFEEATTIDLPIVYDDEVTYSDSAKYISLGANAYSTAANVSISGKKVKKEGFLITTVGKSIFIIGGADIGTLYGVYGFLGRELNYEFFFTDTYSLDQNVVELTLKKYPNLVENPDIDTLQQNYGYITESTMNNYRYKMSKRTDAVVAVGDTVTIHNILYIIPPSIHGTAHPKWFTADNLCFTAHGDEEEYKAMLDVAVENSKIALKQSDALNICIGQPDLVGFCPCEHCEAFASENGGANSSVMIRFSNDLADKLYAWFETDDGKPYSRDLSVFFLAYQTVLQSPTKLNETTNEYEAAGITCNEHVGVYFAADSYNFTVDINHSANSTFVSAMRSWGAVADKFMYWFYDTNFACYLLPYDTFQAKAELYQFAHDMGAVSVFDEAQRQQLGSAPGWSILKAYIESKLRWDVSLNINEITERFFDNCYGEASDLMYDCYKEFRILYRQLVEKKETGELTENVGSIFGQLVSKNVWQKSQLDRWLAKYNQAFELLEANRPESEAKYKAACKLISSERISTLYLILSLYSEYSNEEIAMQKELYKQDLINTGLLYEGPSGSLDAFNSKIGVSLY